MRLKLTLKLASINIVLCLLYFNGFGVTAADDNGNNGTFMCLTLQTPNEIPDECQTDIQMPTKALTGYDVDIQYMCNPEFFSRCRTILNYVFKLIYTDEGRDFIIGLLDTLVEYGPKHTCRDSQLEIDSVMRMGGRDCIIENMIPLRYCAYISQIKFEQETPVESVCYTLDYSFECNLEAISGCKNEHLKRLWENYYRDTIRHSPCSKYSAYGSAIKLNTTIFLCVFTFLSLVFNKIIF